MGICSFIDTKKTSSWAHRNLEGRILIISLIKRWTGEWSGWERLLACRTMVKKVLQSPSSSGDFIYSSFYLRKSNICKHFFSRSKFVLSNYRQIIVPANLESKIFVFVNLEYWLLADSKANIPGKCRIFIYYFELLTRLEMISVHFQVIHFGSVQQNYFGKLLYRVFFSSLYCKDHFSFSYRNK